MKKIIILLLLVAKSGMAQDCIRELGGGACIVMENDKYGIKKKGKYIVPTYFDQIADHSGRYFSVQQGGKWGLFSIKGQIVLPVAFDAVTAIDAQAGLINASGNGYNSLLITEDLVLPKYSVKANPFLTVSQTEVSLSNYLTFVMDLKNNPQKDFTYQMALPDSIHMAANTRKIYHLFMSSLEEDECSGMYEPFENKIKLQLEVPCIIFNSKQLLNLLELPVNGITYAQAQRYCTWLSEKMNAAYTGELPYEMVIRLPRPVEWQEIALNGLFENMKPGLCLDSLNAKSCILFNYRFDKNICTHTETQTKKYGDNVVPVTSYNMNLQGVFCIFGNVAEMTTEEGVAKGGSYLHYARQCNTDHVQKYEGASPWVGFRWVVEYRMKKQ